MKFYQVALTVIIALAANNLVLLHYFKQEPVKGATDISATVNRQAEPSISGKQDQREPFPKPSTRQTLVTDDDSLSVDINRENQEIVNAFETYAKSERFVSILDGYYLSAATRYEEIEQRLNGLSALELYYIATESDNLLEQQSAMQVLAQSKLHQLGASELKTLYQREDVQQWSKTSILNSLLSENDPEAIVWAKQLISNNTPLSYLSDDLYSAIYENDPDFIRNYINEFDIESGPNAYGFYNFVQQEPKLANEFFTKRIDEILDSENGTLFQFGAYNVEFDMTTRQQSKLLSLFESNNQHKRSFAMSLLGNVDDTGMLREAFSKFERARDKRNFLNALSTDKNAEKQALVKELARNSDDPDLQSLFP